jgi:hypothetical protein
MRSNQFWPTWIFVTVFREGNGLPAAHVCLHGETWRRSQRELHLMVVKIRHRKGVRHRSSNPRPSPLLRGISRPRCAALRGAARRGRMKRWAQAVIASEERGGAY